MLRLVARPSVTSASSVFVRRLAYNPRGGGYMQQNDSNSGKDGLEGEATLEGFPGRWEERIAEFLLDDEQENAAKSLGYAPLFEDGARVLEPVDEFSEKMILRDGFTSYVNALQHLIEKRLPASSVAKLWFASPTSFAKLEEGTYKFTDDLMEAHGHGTTRIRVLEQSPPAHTINRYNDMEENENPSYWHRAIMIAWDERKLLIQELGMLANQTVERQNCEVYKLPSEWVTELKKQRYPEHWNHPEMDLAFPVNEGLIEDYLLRRYEPHVSAKKSTLKRD